MPVDAPEARNSAPISRPSLQNGWAVALTAHSARLRESRALPPSLRDFLES